MGQKVNPIGLRLGIVQQCASKWYAHGKEYRKHLISDVQLRDFLKEKLASAGCSRIDIERSGQNISFVIHTARPGIVIGKKGEDIEKLKSQLAKMSGCTVHLNVEEVRKPELDAQLIAESITQQLEKRIMFRRAMKRAVTNALRLRALGIKIMCAGRLNGAEIARTEWYREGRVPLHTLRANIDYGFAEAKTTYGVVGVKVWVFKGESFDPFAATQPQTAADAESATTAMA